MTATGRYTYRQEIAQLRRRVRELTDQLATVREGIVATQGVQVPDAPPERDAVRDALHDREAQLRQLEEVTWKP